MPMLTAPSTIVSSPLLPAGAHFPTHLGSIRKRIESHRLAQVLYNCFLDCLVALPIAARQQVGYISKHCQRCSICGTNAPIGHHQNIWYWSTLSLKATSKGNHKKFLSLLYLAVSTCKNINEGQALELPL
ncbi:PREDICTED: uncharacterized protein LOC103326346 isoform X1 [Prunus mume]|uniref:Uncharacterized protein LOC103326346 isoform X1 n=1 Tax=Prunus mume TaxID=102107 RepID=A0ABM1LHC6_PRUMU|nr:PREDICTED: uncharacterized protein LOC103326346 isoform X1 [Prunus mume]